MQYGQLNDYYNILGISRDVTREEMRKAYRRLVKEHHPDLTRNPGELKRRKEFLKLLNLAYEILSDPAKRTQYDHKTEPRDWKKGHAYGYQRRRTSQTSYRGEHRDPPEVVIRGNEQYLRMEYVKKRFRLKYELGFYIRNNIITFYTTPEGYIYIPLSELERARAVDVDPEAAKERRRPKCVICGVTNTTLRERYFVHNTGIFHIRKMRLRGGILCAKCREKEKWKAVAHNLFLGWWGVEALVYNFGFIFIDLMGGFRGKRSTKSLQEKLRKYSIKEKKYDVYHELSGWRSKMAASLPNYLVDQLLYNDHHSLKAVLFTILLIIIVVRIVIAI